MRLRVRFSGCQIGVLPTSMPKTAGREHLMDTRDRDLLCRICPASNPSYHDLFSQTSQEEIRLLKMEEWGYTTKVASRWTTSPLGLQTVQNWMSDEY